MNATASPAQRDERTIVIENASYRWSYFFLTFGLLGIVAYRSLMRDETPWDLLLLVVLGGGIGTAYQGRHKVLSRQWAVMSLLAVAIAAALAALVAWLH